MAEYLNIDDSRSRVMHLLGYEDEEIDNLEQQEYIDELLSMSSALDPNAVRHYRVFLVSALCLQQSLDDQALSKAENGIEFTGYSKPIESWLKLQQSYDLSKGLDVPLGFSAIEYLNALCGCSEGGYSGSPLMSAMVV